MQLPILCSSPPPSLLPLLLYPLLHLSPPLSIPPLPLSSPPPLSIPPLLSSVFPPPGTGIGYPVPICHPNFIKDWLDIWHLSVGLTSDQHWSEFGDHCSCIWFGEETSYNMSNLNNNKTGFECWKTLGRLRIINLNIINHFAKQSPLLFSITYVVCTRSNHDFLLVASPMSMLKELSQRSVTCLAGFLYWWFGPIYNIAYWYRKPISIIRKYSIDNVDFLAL